MARSQHLITSEPRKTLLCSTDVTKTGVQRTVAKISFDTATTRFGGNGDSITGRAPISVALTLSFPKAADATTDLDTIITELTALLNNATLMAALKNGEA